MTGNLDEAIKTLLTTALPILLGGATPLVALTIESDKFQVDPNAADALASEPRPDDHSDEFLFNPTGIIFDPADPAYVASALPKFTLTKPPYPGPRRVRLLTSSGDRIALRQAEVLWDEVEPRIFTLALAPNRPLTDVNAVQVLYAVIAVFTMLKLNQRVSIHLQASDATLLERCEALVTGIIELNRQELIENSLATFDGGDYSILVKANCLKLLEGQSLTSNQRRLIYHAEIEVKSTRALADNEGRPIVRIRTPGRPLDPARPLDIEIGL